MRVVVFGQKWLAAEVLKGLLAMPEISVVAVCPDAKGDNFAKTARECGVPVMGMHSIPLCDFALAAYCQSFIPGATRARCGMGILAYHPSLLPRHRGRDAIHWTLAMREPVAGGTVYWMDDGADTGPIEAQDWCHVLPGDTAGELWRRELAPMGLRLLMQVTTRLITGIPPRPRTQDERVATWEPSLARPKLQST